MKFLLTIRVERLRERARVRIIKQDESRGAGKNKKKMKSTRRVMENVVTTNKRA